MSYALVTGGAGFIGSNLVEDLSIEGKEVVVLDNMASGSEENLRDINGSIKIINTSCDEISRLDLRPDEIYHLGIPSSSPMYKKNPFLVGEAVNGAIAVFDLARKTGSKVVYASSSSLYSGLTPPHKEEMQIQVTDYYTEARLAIERMAELYRRLFDVRSVGMRFFSVYGPRERAKKQYANIVSQFIWEMMAGKSPVIYGDGNQTRDFIYVKDVVRALKLAMASDCTGILNVGTGTAYSFNEVIGLVNKGIGSEIKPKYVNNPIKNYVMHTMADILKTKELLDFEAICPLEDSIKDLLKYYAQG